MKAADNLEPNIWRKPAVLEATSKFEELRVKGYLLDGTTGLSHTQAQTYWAQRKAVFIPCGAWLENELGSIAPKDLGMTVVPMPGLSSSDKLPFEAISGGPGGELIVPSQAKNPEGGLELLRLMMSKEAAGNFSQLTNSLTVVKGASDGLKLSSAVQSQRDALTAAGKNVMPDYMWRTWYKKMLADSDNAMGALMTGEINSQGFVDRMQKAADATARDSSIKKYTH
jgi:N-acetylglucosamine transport system substrate-binding protein